MHNKILYFIICLASWNSINAQPVYLPGGAENIRHTPQAAANNMVELIEQRGVIAYKAKTCHDESDVFIVGEDGTTKYGNNEWVDVHLHIQSYKPAAKMMFDQIMKLNHPSVDLNRKRDAFKSETNTDGTPKYAIKIVDVADGKMLLLNQHLTCADGKYKFADITSFYSYAVIGSSIIWIDANYGAAMPDQAFKIHNEIVEKIKKTGIN